MTLTTFYPEALASSLHYFLAAVSLCLFAYIIRQRFFHPLSKFNGALLAPYSNLWKGYAMFRGHIEHDVRQLHLKFGPVVRIGPNSLSISHADVTRVVWGEGARVEKSNYYDGFTAIRPNLFGMRSENLHGRRKRTLAHAFSRQSIKSYEAIIDTRLTKLCHTIDEHAASSTPLDLKKLVKLFVFDVLGVLLFNQDFGALESGDVGCLPRSDEHVRIALAAGLVPWTVPYVKLMPRVPIAAIQKLYDGRRMVVQMANECVSKFTSSDKTHTTLLTSLLEARDPDTGEPLHIDDIKSEALGFLNAGSTTTSATTVVLIWHLLSHPDILARLVSELDRYHPTAANCDIYAADDLLNLPYLQACHKEAARIYPIFGTPLPRIVPQDGRSFGPHYIPGGTEVCVWAYIIHNDTSIFGQDVDIFRPERWLEPGANRLNRSWIPFGLGHRGCIGKNLAEMEILKLVATLFRNYEFDMLEPDQSKQFKDCVNNIVGVELKGPLRLLIRKRR